MWHVTSDKARLFHKRIETQTLDSELVQDNSLQLQKSTQLRILSAMCLISMVQLARQPQPHQHHHLLAQNSPVKGEQKLVSRGKYTQAREPTIKSGIRIRIRRKH
jgi:hypothetical protein